MPQRPLPLAASLALSALLLGCASAPGPHAPPDSGDCIDVRRLGAGQLYGSWQVELPDGQRGSLTLRQHPEFSESLRGELHISGVRSIASGDVEGGELNLDESRDGKSLHAFWTGQLTPSACGAEIRGTVEALHPAPGQAAGPQAFVLRRLP